jgi:methyl-accepting chemotaxis protein
VNLKKEMVFLGRFGLRIRIVLVMASTLLFILAAVGIILYAQVSQDMKDTLITRGSGLARILASESKVDLLYGRKKEELQRIRNLLMQQEIVNYVVIVQKGAAGVKDPGNSQVSIFIQQFREEGSPLDLQPLIDEHLGSAGQTIEGPGFFGFTEEIFTGTLLETSEDTAPGRDKDSIRRERWELGDLDDGDETGPAQEPPDKNKAGASIEKPAEKKNLWGYVFLGVSSKRLESRTTKLVTTLSLLLGLAVLFYTALIFISSNRLYRRLLAMLEATRRISKGNLTESIPDATSDEIGKLASAVNTISKSFNDMLRKIAAVTDSLSSAVENITASTEEVVRGAEYQVAAVDETSSSVAQMMILFKGIAENVEVLSSSAEESSSSILEMAATNDEVASNISSLATSVEQTTTNIEQMTTAIKEVAKSVEDLSATTEQTSASMREIDISIGHVEANANETATLSEEVRRDAERGSDAVKKTIQGISRIAESTQTAYNVIEALGKKAQAIGQVLTVIDDVAEQTNLLALNAAIIAAQAGEHGKGFAVVADEIKDLAERTAASTSEISNLIRSVQSESKNVIEAMSRGLKNVEEGVSLSAEAEEALQKIVESSTKSTRMVRAIARATLEQTRGSKEVTSAIQRIAEMVQQIASSTAQQAKGSEQIMNSADRMKIITQQVHASSQEQARGSKQITKAIENISEMVHHLNRAQKEQAHGAEHVMKAVDRIKGVAENHSSSMAKMKSIVDLVAEQADTLRVEMLRFKL